MAQYLADQNSGYECDLDNLIQSVKGNSVLSGGAVVQRAAGANMSVDVSTGGLRHTGLYATLTGGNFAVTTSDPTNARFDLVSVSSAGAVSVTAGTPSATPKPPALPSGNLLLAILSIAAAASSITNSNISSRVLVLADGIISGTLANRPVATIVPSGTIYVASDELSVYRSNATVWVALTGGGVASVNATGAMSADFATGLTKEWATTGNISGITLTNGAPHQWMSIVLKYGGAHTVAFTTTVLWAGGITPTFTSVNGKYDVISLFYDGTNWLGEFSGNH